MKFPPEVAKIFHDLEQDNLRECAELDRANKNYSSTVFEHGMRWRYFEIKKEGKCIRYCWTVTTNATGCYLSFIETLIGKRKLRVNRTNVAPHEKRSEAKAWALKLMRKEKERIIS